MIYVIEELTSVHCCIFEDFYCGGFFFEIQMYMYIDMCLFAICMLRIGYFSFLQEFHAELLGKENLVTDIRTKGQELLKTKQGVPGLDVCQQQLAELGMSWL